MRDHVTDGRITIRRYAPGDENALHEAVTESIRELTKYDFFHAGYSLQDAKISVDSNVRSWGEGSAYYYVIEGTSTGRYLGHCSIAELDLASGVAVIGYWVRTSSTRQGIATAAARLVACLGFEDLGLAHLYIPMQSGNVASRRVAEKLGAVPEPTEQVDCWMYGLTPRKPQME